MVAQCWHIFKLSIKVLKFDDGIFINITNKEHCLQNFDIKLFRKQIFDW